MITLQAVFGILAGILSFVAYPIYVRDILRGETKPSRITWWILALLNIALTVSYYSAGARDTIWIPVSYSIGFTIVAVLSIKYGEGGWEKTDIACLVGALVSLLLWWLFNSPAIAVLLIVLTDLLGLIPTIRKAYSDPHSESRLSWLIGTAASLLNMFAIDQWTLVIAVYPIYVFLSNLAIVSFIYRVPPKKVTESHP